LHVLDVGSPSRFWRSPGVNSFWDFLGTDSVVRFRAFYFTSDIFTVAI